MERIAILFAFGLIYLTPASEGTSHHGWTEVENFSCNRTAFEMVMRTTESGSMQSPCYNDGSGTYLEELSGTKLINITYDSPFVVGYRLTFRVFDLGLPDRLYVGNGTRMDGRNVIGIRLLTFRNDASNTNVEVSESDDGKDLGTLILSENNTYLLQNYKTVIMDFLTSNDDRVGKQGFLIDYDADIDKCLMTGDNVYCKNNGVCTKSGFNTTTCNCTGTGYEGTICDMDIDECNEKMDDCHSNATCTNNQGSFDCACIPGYTGDGRTCTDIDECTVETDACEGTGNCSDTEGGFNCTCFSGYTGGSGGPCTNINECLADDNKCHENATCADGIGSYTCTCKTGYTGNGENCTDIDECAQETDNCHGTRAACTNNNGSFVCNCNTGYSGDGVTCEDINECITGDNDCHSNATCSNTDGNWTCACKNGFTGNGTYCEDNDECALGEDNCHTNANCTNKVGSFECTCKDGYSGDGQTCSNINECVEGSNSCHEKAECTDNDGSYTCACTTGYTGDGNTCTDIDECRDDIADDCSDNANCTNTEGSYTCECKTGYSGDGKTCANIDECTADPAPCGMNTDCTDNNGSFVCTCKTGYDGDAYVNCTDINECEASPSPCDLDETSCQNTVGSFQCVCSFPTFRGTPGNCDYYCDHNSTCLQNREGYIDVPTGWDGIKKYSTFDETFYNFSDTATATVHGGIRFTILQFNTEAKDDILSIYPAGSLQVVSKEIVGLSGSKDNTYNKEVLITGMSREIANTDSGVTAFFNRSGGDPTLTLSTSFLNIAFTSDRENASTGFWIAFEYDKDDCENVMSCVNATGCIDGVFAYQCNCTSGFEGIDCDLDIDECNLETSCDGNATCNNTVGSYICTCNDYYFGDGKSCKPHVILSEYSVTQTTTSLSVTFDITASWRTNEFFKYFRIELEGNGETKVYENVTLSDLSGDGFTMSGLSPYTPYNITVTVQERGPLYDTAEVENNLGTKRFYTAEQAAGVPKNLATGSGTRDRVTITWEKPDEIGYGIVTSYELCYQPSSGDKTQQIAALRNIPTTPTCFFIDDTYTSYTWVGLPSYLSLSFMIRANSIAGAGNFTSIQMGYTGSSCPEWTSFAARQSCPLMQGLLESEGFPRNTTSSEDLEIEQQWSHDLTTYNGWRPNFIYFNTLPGESMLDAGYGDVDVTDHDTERASRLYSYTGLLPSGPNPVEGYPKNSSISDQNTLWFAFISDRFRKRSGFQVEIEVDGDNCISTPCLNGGACADKLYGYECTCTSEWTGDSCQTPRVEPVVTCTPDKKKVDVSFTIPAGRGIDETIIGGYTIDYGAEANQVENAIGETSASFSGLVPYTEYTITVTVKESNRTVVLVPGTTTCRTLEDVPTAPQNVMVIPGDEYLNVTWDAPAQPNGVVTYMVNATQTDHEKYDETADEKTSGELTTTSYKIENLRVYRTYSVVVQARTSAGSINADAASEVTNPGPPLGIAGKVTVLTSTSARIEWTLGPGSYPGPTTISITATSESHNPATVTLPADTPSPHDFTQLEEGFSYTVTVTASTGVSPDTSFTQANVNTNETAPGKPATFTYDRETSTFSWSAPTILEQNGEITGYVLKSENTVPGFNSPMEFDATTLSYQLLGLPPYTEYTFTLQAINSVGQGAIFSLPIVTKEAVPDPVSDVTEDEILARQVKLSWKAQDPAVGNVIYEVFYSDGTTTSPTQSTAITTYTFTGLTPFTEYTFSIVATTNAGKATAVTRKITTAEDVPSAVQNLDATYNGDPIYSISVTWDAPATPNGVITGYIVSLSPGDSAVVPATSRQYVFEKVVGSETTYTITVTASTSAGAGPDFTDSVTTPVIVPKEPTSLAVPEAEITATTATITGTPPANTGDGFVVVTRYIVTLNGDQDDCNNKGDTSCRSNDKSNTFTAFPYVITGLMAYRKYIITVAAESGGGVGAESTSVEFTTLAGEPGTPTIQVVAVPGGFNVIFTPSRPYTGPASYTATATPSEGDPITNTVGPIDSIGLITVELRNLPGDAQYTITGQASNDQGTSAATSPETVQSTPVAPQVSVAATAEGEITVTMPERADVTYTVTYAKVVCDDCTPVPRVIAGNVEVISGLDPYSNYSITVFATSSAGDGESRTEYQLSQAGTPQLRDPGYVLVLSNDTSGIDTAVSVRVDNLCTDKAGLFVETEGPITQIAYFVIQKGSEQFINVSFNVFYGDVIDETQKRVYRTITVNCNGARRKKRQTANEQVVIGNEDCSASQEGECNGRLTPSTTYRTQACGMNQDGRYACTNPSSEFTTSARPTGGLTGGEIAAIVICSILLLVLIVLIVIYCCKKRNQSGKAKISKKGSDNPGFDDKAASRYQVNPAAEPRTEYTDQPVA